MMDVALEGPTAGRIIEIIRGDGPFLFLGSAFVAAGLIAAAFGLLGRKLNAMLLWLAAFATLYGVRLWLQLGTLRLMIGHTAGFNTVRGSLNYLVPIPVVMFFDVAGFLGRFGRRASIGMSVVFVLLAACTVTLGPRPWIDEVNSGLVIVGLCVLMISLFSRRKPDRDFEVIRWALSVFVALAVFDNVGDMLGFYPHVEPIGFAVFLVGLGYVAANRALRRDEQLTEIQKELDIARQIQTSILPAAFPESEHFKVAVRYAPMTSVAGDFYDFPVVAKGRAGLLIADVAGHGVPAALIASMVKLAGVSQASHVAEPAAFLAGMNQVLCGNTQGQYVTAAYLYLDADAGMLHYGAAAHPPMLLLRDGAVQTIEENGLMLGAFSFATYTDNARALVAGDRLLLYTDGLVEAANRDGEEFGMSRLQAEFLRTVGLRGDEAADGLLAAVRGWSAVQSDDLTLLICDYSGTTRDRRG
jgi:sigma-B regulation protein RsbU (phosphoserine phosphatase)